MRVERYFTRIGYDGAAAVTVDTLFALQRLHVLAVPFENLDVQLGRALTTAPEEAYEKIVERGRGGWCYEHNGLLGWALAELGFEVTRLSAAVMRADRGPIADHNHLSLLVGVPGDRRYVVDVGFGGSMLRPLPFENTESSQLPYRVGLRRLDGGTWQFWEDYEGDEFNYDFDPVAADERALSRKCADLQSNPESTFVLNLVAQRRRPDEHLSLRGRVLKRYTASGTREQLLASAGDLVHVLRDQFDIDVPEVGDLWSRVLARHELLFGEGQEPAS